MIYLLIVALVGIAYCAVVLTRLVWMTREFIVRIEMRRW